MRQPGKSRMIEAIQIATLAMNDPHDEWPVLHYWEQYVHDQCAIDVSAPRRWTLEHRMSK